MKQKKQIIITETDSTPNITERYIDPNESNDSNESIIPLKVGSPKKLPAKLTKPKRVKVLESLSKEWNVTKAASKIGVSRQAVFQLVERDPIFKKAFQAIEQAYLDKIESVSVDMACTPTREGFNDRKLQLMSRRREVYGQQPEVQINQQFNFNDPTLMQSELSKIVPDDD